MDVPGSTAVAVSKPTVSLIMKGGGMKGLALVGAVRELEKCYQFDIHVGTSAGAIVAALLSLGYSGRDLEKILRAQDFKELLDGRIWAAPYNLLVHKGIHPGLGIEEWIRSLINKRSGRVTDLKLCHLRKLIEGKRLIIYASQHGGGTVTFDSHGEGSDTEVHSAVRYSMSIPYFFMPLFYNSKRIYDGGMLASYPLDTFLRQQRDHETPCDEFIALYLGALEPPPLRARFAISEILNSLLERNDRDMVDNYRDHTVIIDPAPVATTQFSLSKDEKNLLVLRGRVAAIQYLRDHNVPNAPSKRKLDRLSRCLHGVESKISAAREQRQFNRWQKLMLRRWKPVLTAAVIVGGAVWGLSRLRHGPASDHKNTNDNSAVVTTPQNDPIDHNAEPPLQLQSRIVSNAYGCSNPRAIELETTLSVPSGARTLRVKFKANPSRMPPVGQLLAIRKVQPFPGVGLDSTPEELRNTEYWWDFDNPNTSSSVKKMTIKVIACIAWKTGAVHAGINDCVTGTYSYPD